MAHRDAIIRFCNTYLHAADFSDYGPIGLHVEGAATVKRIVFAVSASEMLFQKAIAGNAQMIICHHGMLWDNESRIIKGSIKKRIHALLNNDITLLGYHLCLDAHPIVGNNAVLAKRIGLKKIKPFAVAKGQAIGKWGVFSAPCSRELVYKKVKNIVGASNMTVYPFGPQKIKTVGIVSGGGAFYVRDAAACGFDMYITGESAEPIREIVREEGINFCAAGHYNTETFGVQALMAVVKKKFGVKTVFIDIPNEM